MILSADLETIWHQPFILMPQDRKQYLTRRLNKVMVPIIQTGLIPNQRVCEAWVAVTGQLLVQKVYVVIKVHSFRVLLYTRAKLNVLEGLLEFGGVKHA